MDSKTQIYADRFEAFLDDPEGAAKLEGAYSIAKWMRFAGIPATIARRDACLAVLKDRVSDGRMIKGLAGFGCGFARGTIVYMLPTFGVVPTALQVAA